MIYPKWESVRLAGEQWAVFSFTVIKISQVSFFSGPVKQEDWNVGGPTTLKFIGGPA